MRFRVFGRLYLMSATNCCSFPRSSSTDLPNSRVVGALRQIDYGSLQQFDPISVVTPASTMGSAQSREVRQIFASSQDDNAPGSSLSIRRRKRPKREIPATIHHKDSTGRLYTFAERLKRKMSRESGLTKRSSRMRLKHSISEEDIERRQELKRALHRRLQEDLLRDRSANEGGYDEDAMPIPTPHMTLGRNEDFDQMNLKSIADDFTPPNAPQTSDQKLSGLTKPCNHSTKVTTIQDGSTVRNVLRKKSSAHATLHTGHHPPDSPPEPDIRIAAGQSTSPFHFNNLVIPKRSRLSLRNAPTEQSGTAKGDSDTLRPRVLVKGASGVFGRSTPNMRLQFGYSGKRSRQLSHGANCDPATEESGFGGIDGAADRRENVRVFTKQKLISRRETQAGQHTAARKIRVSQSLSQIAENSGQWHKRSSSSIYSKQPNMYRSSSQYSARSSMLRNVVPRTNPHPDRSYDNLSLRQPHQHIASSVYSSYCDSRHDVANLDGSREPYPTGRRHSTAYDLFSAENKAASPLWGKAVQDHAEEKPPAPAKRRNSMLPGGKISMVVRRRVSILKDAGRAIPKRESSEGRRHGLERPVLRRHEEYSSASSLRSVSPSGRDKDPTASTKATRKRGRHTSPARSSGSWARFPSHTRPNRSSSPASSSDGVLSRDFGMEIAQIQDPNSKPFRTLPAIDKRKSRSLSFRKSLTNTLGRLYRSQVELRGYMDKGHRSSISAGGLSEYPELEVPAGLGEGAASAWSKMYEDCVPPRDAIDASSVVELDLPSPTWRPNVSREHVARIRKTSEA